VPDSTPSLISVDPKPRLSDTVAEQILDTIVSRRLRPGEALPTERELGEQFGVSRTVIREAVRALGARGLVDVRVGSRIKVAAVDPSTVSEAIVNFVRSRDLDTRAVAEMIAALDPAIARLAAEHATEQDLDRIATALARIENETADRTASVERTAFEEAVVSATHNDLLIAVVRALQSVQPAAFRTRPAGGGAAHYRELATAISRGDTDAATRAFLRYGEHRQGGGHREH
jgi:GntR family transcriptional repressor for pyruvate dehydrogenase complex